MKTDAEKIAHLETDAYHLARLGLNGKRSDIVMYLRRMIHRLRMEDSPRKDKMRALLTDKEYMGNILREDDNAH